MVTALALGARAVLLGRPVMWAPAADGEHGVEDMLTMLRQDLVRTLTLMGVDRVSDLGPEHLVRPGPA